MFEVVCVGCGAQLWTHLICENCRRHIEIGKAVEGMPEHTALYHGIGHDQKSSWEFDPDTWYGLKPCVIEATPLEALTKGKRGSQSPTRPDEAATA